MGIRGRCDPRNPFTLMPGFTQLTSIVILGIRVTIARPVRCRTRSAGRKQGTVLKTFIELTASALFIKAVLVRVTCGFFSLATLSPSLWVLVLRNSVVISNVFRRLLDILLASTNICPIDLVSLFGTAILAVVSLTLPGTSNFTVSSSS